MKQKIVVVTVVSLGIMTLVAVGTVSAHGMFWGGKLDPQEVVSQQQTMFQSQADLLGISVDKLKNYWAQGKNIKDIMTELGISQDDLQAKMKAQRLNQEKERFIEEI